MRRKVLRLPADCFPESRSGTGIPHRRLSCAGAQGIRAKTAHRLIEACRVLHRLELQQDLHHPHHGLCARSGSHPFCSSSSLPGKSSLVVDSCEDNCILESRTHHNGSRSYLQVLHPFRAVAPDSNRNSNQRRHSKAALPGPRCFPWKQGN